MKRNRKYKPIIVWKNEREHKLLLSRMKVKEEILSLTLQTFKKTKREY